MPSMTLVAAAQPTRSLFRLLPFDHHCLRLAPVIQREV
jgi:hypothetical protein